MRLLNRTIRHSRRNLFSTSLAAALLIAACGGAPAESTALPPAAGANAAVIAQPTPTAPSADNAALVALASPPPAQSAPVDTANLIASVNAEPITREMYDRALVRYQQQLFGAEDPQVSRDRVLNMLIEQMLIEQAAAAQNIAVTDADLDAEIAASIELAGGQQGWQAWLNANGYTDTDFRETLRATLLTNRMRDLLTQELSAAVDQVHARHILIRSESEARALLARMADGEDFAALAAANSLDVTSRNQGGDLGWFTRDQLLEAGLAQTAFAIQPGTIAGPIQSSLGWHILQVLERGQRAVPEDQRAELAQVRFESWLAEIAARAVIERY